MNFTRKNCVSIWKFRKKKKGKLGPAKFHGSIRTLSQHAWEQMNIHSDPLWLLEDQSDRSRKIDPDEIENAYFKIYDEYAEVTGLHDTMDRWRDLMIMRIEARAEVAEGDRSALNRVELYSDQIKQLMRTSSDSDVVKNRMMVQQAYGQPIKPQEITVYEYLMISKLLSEQASKTTPTEDGTD